MQKNVDELIYQVKKFRKAIEGAGFTVETVGTEANLRMKNFPDGVCSEACTILGIFLKNDLGISPIVEKAGQIELGEKWYGSHHWLEKDGLIIDITADQFPMIEERIIITHKSEFHKTYAHKVSVMTENFSLNDHPEWLHNIYDSVKREFRNQ